MLHSCKNCIFFVETFVDQGIQFGDCYRFPPTLLYNLDHKQLVNRRPQTFESNFCGEYKPKDAIECQQQSDPQLNSNSIT